jgi:hypothetical protein
MAPVATFARFCMSIGGGNDDALLHAKYEIAHKRRTPDPRR